MTNTTASQTGIMLGFLVAASLFLGWKIAEISKPSLVDNPMSEDDRVVRYILELKSRNEELEKELLEQKFYRFDAYEAIRAFLETKKDRLSTHKRMEIEHEVTNAVLQNRGTRLSTWQSVKEILLQHLSREEVVYFFKDFTNIHM